MENTPIQTTKTMKQGFTLLELILVIAIIGVLSTVTIPKVNQYILQAQIRVNVASAHNVYTAMFAHDLDNNKVGVNNVRNYFYGVLDPYIDGNAKMSGSLEYSQYYIKGFGYFYPYHGYNEATGKYSYFVYYYDPRVPLYGTATIPATALSTALVDGVPCVTRNTIAPFKVNADGTKRFQTVAEYLASK